jgi:MoaA/NifB/PqqE/SkfB family radical SAM enzyme
MRIGLLFLAVLLAPVGAATSQQNESARTAKPAFSLSISAAQDVVKTGSAVTMNVVLTNISDHKIEFP